MQSNKWGPLGWDFSHAVTFNYPLEPTREEKQQYKNYFVSFSIILPCRICSNSFKFFYENLPINDYLEDRNGITYWLYIIHNLVNLKLGNPIVHFKDVILKYENMRARCGNINTKDKQILEDCQLPLEWNRKMERFMNDTFEKYHNMTIRRIVKMIKKHEERPEICNILKNIKLINEDINKISSKV